MVWSGWRFRVSRAIFACKQAKKRADPSLLLLRYYCVVCQSFTTTDHTLGPRSRCCCVPRSLFGAPDHTRGPRSRCCCAPRPFFWTTVHTLVSRSRKLGSAPSFLRKEARVSSFFSKQGKELERREIHPSPAKSLSSSLALLPFTLPVIHDDRKTLGPRSRCCCGPRIGHDTWRELMLERATS